MGKNKQKIIDEQLIPESWTTKKCQKIGCDKTYGVNPYTKKDNDLGYCDDCLEEVFPKKD